MAESDAEQKTRWWNNLVVLFATFALVGFTASVVLVFWTLNAAYQGTGTFGDAAQSMLALAVFSLSAVQVSLNFRDRWRKKAEAESTLL